VENNTNGQQFPDPDSPLNTMPIEELAAKIEVEQGPLIAGKTMCALTIFQALQQGSSLDEALSLAEHVARLTPASFDLKSMRVGCAIVLQ
jgi:hypothetical protein